MAMEAAVVAALAPTLGLPLLQTLLPCQGGGEGCRRNISSMPWARAEPGAGPGPGAMIQGKIQQGGGTERLRRGEGQVGGGRTGTGGQGGVGGRAKASQERGR